MTPSISNGIFLRDTNMRVSSHIDSYHLLNLVNNPKPDDMGFLDLWAMLKKVDVPLYSLGNMSKRNMKPVIDAEGRWTWKVPVPTDLPFSVEDMDPTNTTKGVDGQEFQMKMSRREFGKGDIITYDKYNGVELYIVPARDIIDAGDHCIYTVQLVNNDNVQYLDNQFLASNTKYFRVGSARGEYGEEFSDMNVQTGWREYINFLPTGHAHVHYTVSSRADMMLRGHMNADGTIPVTEIWSSADAEVQNNPSITDLNSLIGVMGPEYVKKARSNGDLSMNYLTRMEATHATKVAKDIEYYLLWGKGGRVRQDGPDDIRMSVGLWKQLDSGYKRIYNKNSFSLELFRNELYNYYNGRVTLDKENPERTLEVQTGMAGAQMLNTLIAKEAAGLGWIINADRSGVNAVYGQGMSLGYGFWFNEIIIPFFAKLKITVNSAFDPTNENTLENPIIDGFPLSSYSFIIHDINDSVDNVNLMKHSWDPGFRWWYENGTMDYMGRASGFQGGRKNGYTLFMEQAYPALWVIDPTKLLKIVLRNPITGGSL